MDSLCQILLRDTASTSRRKKEILDTLFSIKTRELGVLRLGGNAGFCICARLLETGDEQMLTLLTTGLGPGMSGLGQKTQTLAAASQSKSGNRTRDGLNCKECPLRVAVSVCLCVCVSQVHEPNRDCPTFT